LDLLHCRPTHERHIEKMRKFPRFIFPRMLLQHSILLPQFIVLAFCVSDVNLLRSVV